MVPRRCSRSVASLACLALGSWWTPASAQTSPDAALAEALFAEGRQLLASGRAAEACPKLAESQRLDPGGGTLLNLAICLRAEGKTATAWATFREALAVARREGRRDRQGVAEASLASLEPQLARLSIDTRALERPRVTVRGRPFPGEGFGVPTPVDPGPVAIDACWPDGRCTHTSVEALPGATRAVALAPLPPEPAPDRSGLRATGIATIGLGAASLIVGAVLGLNAIDRAAASDDACRSATCTPRGNRLESQASDLGTAANVTLGAGLALAVGGGVLVFVARDEHAPAARVTARWVLP